MSNKKSLISFLIRSVVILSIITLYVIFYDYSPRFVFADDVSSGLTSKYSKSSFTMQNVNELKSSNLPLGSTATTLGFYNSNDNGGGQYIISDSPAFPLYTNLSLALNNGLFANLVFDNSSIINIQTFGITDNGYIATILNNISPYLSGKIDGIRFPAGEYYINTPIIIGSFNLYGTEKSYVIIDDNYSSDCFACIRTDTEVSNKLGFYDIHIIANIDNNFARKGETALVYLRSIEKCVIDNCTFEANESADIDAFIPIDLVWFQTNNAKNITVTNSKFSNNTGVNYLPGTNPGLVGGCLWFSGTSDTINETYMTDIMVSNCNFFNSVRDEHMALWHGHFNNFTLQQCTFSNSSNHTSDNYLSFHGGSFNNINISNVNMTFNSSTMYPIKFTDFVSESDFTVNNLDLLFDFKELSDPYHHSFSVFYTDADQHVDNDVPANITISNSEFIANSDLVWYYSIFKCRHTTQKNINIQNCTSNIKYELTSLYIDPNNTVTENGFSHR